MQSTGLWLAGDEGMEKKMDTRSIPPIVMAP